MSGPDQVVTSGPDRVVLAPDVVGGLWLEPACAAVFEAWRDEKLRPVVNRELLVRYVRLWRSLGLAEVQVRRWSWWFTSPVTACFIAEDVSNSACAVECCSRLAVLSNVGCVVHRGVVKAPEGGIQWRSAVEFLSAGQQGAGQPISS